MCLLIYAWESIGSIKSIMWNLLRKLGLNWGCGWWLMIFLRLCKNKFWIKLKCTLMGKKHFSLVKSRSLPSYNLVLSGISRNYQQDLCSCQIWSLTSKVILSGLLSNSSGWLPTLKLERSHLGTVILTLQNS